MSYRTGFVALLGRPNAGKSTLMNALVREKISIVSSKPQTTRRRVMGIMQTENMQCVFADAPGLVKAEKGLNAFLQKEAYEVFQDSDAALILISHDEKPNTQLEDFIQKVVASQKPYLFLFNKSDLAPSDFAQSLKMKLVQMNQPILAISAKKDRDLVERLQEEIFKLLPEADGPLYPEQDLTLENSRVLASEFVREKCFEHLHDEIPFGLAVRITKFDEERDDLVKIFADILVDKENHKSMVIGQKGQMIKKIGQEARKDLERLLQIKIYLELHVVVRPGWTEKDVFLKELGYEHRKEKK